jgi:hypothetical protein
MPAVHEIIATINQFAQARLPAAAWRGRRLEATRLLPAGWMKAAPLAVVEIPESAYAHAGVEPPLEEMLSDPVIHLMMQADRLHPAELRRLVEDVRGQPAASATTSQ